ncbi:helix-turn-helix domain-containing protein [Planococcus shenhongbingii]|uniref:Helix-turn-helix domain-containing protein n=1 Tax=Planococcus shenhongbingii TaxID=3058398 RepID=A0ABT8NEP4_9BACL|nr:helix-turn-helix domain-containing protein [Planococcus sp. N017]MDN7246360.1 helix-turn-helix domain-containing protein [Planococcus sp. N017]
MEQKLSSNHGSWGKAVDKQSQVLRKGRSIEFSRASFSAWQLQLIKTLGLEKVKKNFFQFGWSQGKDMARTVNQQGDLDLISQMLRGAEIHEAFGQAQVTIDVKKIEVAENEVVSVLFKGRWSESFEASNYINEGITAVKPVCYTLCGFASGYISTLIGKEVFFKEQACEASGEGFCQWEGKLLEHWNPSDYESFFGPELEENPVAFSKVEEERNRLQTVIDIHNELTEELIRSNRLKNILSILRKYISEPIIIENQKGQITDFENIGLEEATELQGPFHKRLKEWPIQKAEFLQCEHYGRLTAPIYIQNQILGYCSFIYEKNKRPPEEIDRMILGRLTSISALVYLNNKNIMEANARTKGILFEKMLTDGFESKEQIIRELNLLNIDVSGKYHVAYLALGYNEFDEEDNLSTFTSIYEEVVQFFQERSYEVLQVQRANGILCFIPEDADHELMHNGPAIFYERIRRFYPKIHCHVGVSSTCQDLSQVNDRMKEAMTAARFTTELQPTISFNELGILGILVHSQEEKAIRKIAEMELGALYGTSEQQKEYMLTLYEFLMNGGNLELTSANLKLSVSGLRYRINRISEIAKVDLRDSGTQFDLLLALKALKVIGEF